MSTENKNLAALLKRGNIPVPLAQKALEECGDNLLDAILYLESTGILSPPSPPSFSTCGGEAAASPQKGPLHVDNLAKSHLPLNERILYHLRAFIYAEVGIIHRETRIFSFPLFIFFILCFVLFFFFLLLFLLPYLFGWKYQFYPDKAYSKSTPVNTLLSLLNKTQDYFFSWFQSWNLRRKK